MQAYEQWHREEFGPCDSEIESMYMARDGRSPQDPPDEEASLDVQQLLANMRRHRAFMLDVWLAMEDGHLSDGARIKLAGYDQALSDMETIIRDGGSVLDTKKIAS